MTKKGTSRPGFFGTVNHYDANGKKTGYSTPGFFGGMNHYDDKGRKVGQSTPGFFGGLNHYDDKGHKVENTEVKEEVKVIKQGTVTEDVLETGIITNNVR